MAGVRMKRLSHQIKFVSSMIVSDDTGQLLRLIKALTILVGLLITILEVIVPFLEALNDIAIVIQNPIRCYKPFPIGVG